MKKTNRGIVVSDHANKFTSKENREEFIKNNPACGFVSEKDRSDHLDAHLVKANGAFTIETSDKEELPGYHLSEIPKGVLGEISKIKEELDELKDALDQECKIMALVELSDLYGAIEFFLKSKFPNISMDDLKKMNTITQRAFRNGRRS